MLEWLLYRRALFDLWRGRRRIDRGWNKEDRAAARGEAAHDEESRRNYRRMELQANEDDRAVLETKKLIREAYRLGLRLPEGDVWDTSMLGNQQMLQREPLADLRAAVRKEQNERWQYWEIRMRIIGALLTAATGAMGALIGVLAILR